MNILIDREGRPEGLRALLAQMAADPAVASVLVLTADGNGWTPAAVDDILKESGKPLFGGVFPQILHGAEHLERGTVALGLPQAAQVAVIEGLSDTARDFEADLNAAFPDPLQGGTMFVMVDGFSRRISALVDALFNVFGPSINYLGGGAGSLSMIQKPCIITARGLLEDAAVLAWAGIPSHVGVAHGWEQISNAYRVTEAEGNVIVSLDWRPAFEVYRESVEANSGQRFTPENFFAIAKAYPFGIARLGDEVVVRDPIKADGDRLVCVGETQVGAFVHILNGSTESLITAAGQARRRAETALGAGTPAVELLIDCISRVLFLEHHFDREMVAASIPGLPRLGALTIGEIANGGGDYLEFYNKTTVVALLEAMSA